MNVWETNKGVTLVETWLKQAMRTRQRLMVIEHQEQLEELSAALNTGGRIVSTFTVDGKTCVVLEKK